MDEPENTRADSSFVVSDIQERPTNHSKPPAPPSLKDASTDLPFQQRKFPLSGFKKSRLAETGGVVDPSGSNGRGDESQSLWNEPSTSNPTTAEAKLKSEIDAENKQKLAQMSDVDIERERQELLSSLSPSLVEKLLQRSTIDDVDSNVASLPPPDNQMKIEASPAQDSTLDATSSRLQEADAAAASAKPLSSALDQHDPDPSSPNFLEHLHQKYFPSLPTDPEKLAWMADVTADEDSSPYSPEQAALLPSSLRFSFRGQLLPPRTAREIPVTEGLHHHGDAPESAGYTIPELARLARSVFPAQRCMSYQTLGQVLYRLGKGEFGDRQSDMVQGLWKCIADGRVIDTLREESQKPGGHVSAKFYATEALSLWQEAGGYLLPAK